METTRYENLRNDEQLDEIFEDLFDEEKPLKGKKRAARRKKNYAKAIRKKKIAANVGGLRYKNTHQYSKNKIHCSCPLCAFSGLTHSDVMRLACMEARLRDYQNGMESEGENHE